MSEKIDGFQIEKHELSSRIVNIDISDEVLSKLIFPFNKFDITALEYKPFTRFTIAKSLDDLSNNKLSKFLLKTKINDMTSGFRCYSNKALLEISYATTKSDGYAFQVEMSARAVQKQLSIKEVPIIFSERRLGNSKMSKKIVYEAFLYLVKNGMKRWLKIKIM